MNEHQVLVIDKAVVRKFILWHQGLLEPIFFNKEGIVEFVGQVGCIQYDPLNMVARNADLVLQSRIPNYQETMLDELLYQDRQLIDGWDKMMSIYSTKDWPYMLPIREAHKSAYRHHLNDTLLVDTIMDHFKRFGARFPSDISSISEGDATWGSRKASSVVLDYLYLSGVIGIKNKKNAIRQFDLIENLLPNNLINQTSPFKNNHEFMKWYMIRKINSVGVYWDQNGIVWQNAYTKRKSDRMPYLNELVSSGELIAFHLPNHKQTLYITAQNYHNLKRITKMSFTKQVKILAPLDNLLWDRDLVRVLFNFDYVWEVYKPAHERKYGYYVLPVLYGDSFIARFDGKFDRQSKCFVVYHWWWEQDVKKDEIMFQQLERALNVFCQFLGAKSIDDTCLKDSMKQFL